MRNLSLYLRAVMAAIAFVRGVWKLRGRGTANQRRTLTRRFWRAWEAGWDAREGA